MTNRLDVLVLVPFQPVSGLMMDPPFRQTAAAYLVGPLFQAYMELCAYLRVDLDFSRNRPVFSDQPVEFAAHRSLGAVTLATQLERAGLSWHVVDSGTQELRYWRRQLEDARERRPRAVAVSTTFLMSAPWLRALCAEIRRALPGARIVLGGYYYTSDTRAFLQSDADILCVGEGELRLPAVIRAIRDGAPLDAIRGLYVRGPDGDLTFTGEAEPLDINRIPPADYRLAERMEPPLSLANDVVEFGLETQRGCVFKCEFCTYRTLSTINIMDVDEAAGRVASTRLASRGLLTLMDATASFPHDRWTSLLQRIIDRGGSPHPMWAFARVSDISDRAAGLMAKAGGRELFIGQESGDQRILNRMRKGTRVDQVRPALRAVPRHGLTANFGFIHGFPGEDDESIAATRTMLAELNQENPSRPVSLWYKLDPFVVFDFASVARDEMKGVGHYLGYNAAAYSPQRACSAVLETVLATSRVPHAPVYEYTISLMNSVNRLPTMASQSVCTDDRVGLYRWLKAVERGVAIFVERDLEGKQPDDNELRRIRESIVAQYPGRQPVRGGIGSSIVRPLVRRLRREFVAESRKGIGPLTRTLLSVLALSDTGRVGPALRCLTRGEYGLRVAGLPDGRQSAPDQVDALATRLLTQSADAADRSRKLLRLSSPLDRTV